MIKKLIARLLAAAFLIGSFAVLAGCNTMAGAGQDIERGGAAIRNEANEKR